MKKYLPIPLFICLIIFVIIIMPCRTCNGESKIYCSECYEGKIDCENCVSGLTNYGPCYRCDKKGYTDVYICTRCNGSGQITNPLTWEKFVCTACNGDMYLRDYCTSCDGEGFTGNDCPECSDGYNTCPACSGWYSKDCPDCD